MAKKTREDWIDERRRELGMSWYALASRVHSSTEALRNVRRGGNAYPKTVRNLEATLGWALGSLMAIDHGGAPTVVSSIDMVTPSVPIRLALATEDDPALQLRSIRDRLGHTAFWLLVDQMRSEEDATKR